MGPPPNPVNPAFGAEARKDFPDLLKRTHPAATSVVGDMLIGAVSHMSL
jgi:hypothetical protein